MALFVAIDCGGTKTRCWIADETRVLAKAECGTVKLMVVGAAVATQRMEELVRGAARDADVKLNEITRTCVGLAGFGSANVYEWGKATLGALVSGELVLVGDETVAFEAAFRGGPGVFLIAGTGAIISARCSDGSRFGAGGFGPVLGDEGSGAWIGWEGVRAGFRARDRGEATILLDAVQQFWGLNSLAELIAKGNDRERANFAELAEVVAQCAERGDAVAIDVLRRGGKELAEQVLLAVKKMQSTGCAATDYARLQFTGSAVGKIAIVREAMTARLHEELAIDVPTEEVNAVEGALWLARDVASERK